MKSCIIFTFFFLSSIHFYSFSQTTTLRKEDLIKDLDVYRDSILGKHVNPFTKISRKEFSNEIEQIKISASQLNANEILVAFLKVNAKIGDEHTGFIYKDPKVFPLYLYWFEEGLCVLSADTEYRDLITSRILRINNFLIDEVAAKVGALIPGTDAQKRKTIPDYVCSAALLNGLNVIDNIDSCMFLFVRQNGDTIIKKVETKNSKELIFEKDQLGDSFLRNQVRDNYWYRYDSTSNSLYFQYRRCKEDPKKLFGKFREELFHELESKKAKRLIIDLRYNSGGSSLLLNRFNEQLWNTTVRKNRELFVLIGRRTFSSAVLNAFELKSNNDAILVGEETGGSVNHFGQINDFQLPNTKMWVSYSTKYIVKDKNQNGSLKPDKIFPVKFSDFINGIDPALEYAKTH